MEERKNDVERRNVSDTRANLYGTTEVEYTAGRSLL